MINIAPNPNLIELLETFMTTSGQGPSDFRFTAFDFDPTKYDAMMSSFDSVNDQLENIPDLLNVRVVRTLENRMMVMSGYRSRDAPSAATDDHVQSLLISPSIYSVSHWSGQANVSRGSLEKSQIMTSNTCGSSALLLIRPNTTQ